MSDFPHPEPGSVIYYTTPDRGPMQPPVTLVGTFVKGEGLGFAQLLVQPDRVPGLRPVYAKHSDTLSAQPGRWHVAASDRGASCRNS